MERRKILITSSGVLMGLAGCLTDDSSDQPEQDDTSGDGQADENGSETEEEQSSSTGDYIEQWGTTETHLYVDFVDTDGIGSVSLIDPVGEQLTTESVGTGASRISMQVVRDGYDGLRYLDDGEYSLVLADADGNEVENVPMEINRGIEVTNAATGLEYEGEYEDDVVEEDLVVTVKNTGTFPVGLSGYENEVLSAPGQGSVENQDDPVDLSYTQDRSDGVSDFERLDEPESDAIENRLTWHIGGGKEMTIRIENFFRSRFGDLSSFANVSPTEDSSGFDEEFSLNLQTHYDLEQAFVLTVTIDGDPVVREEVFGAPDGIFLFDEMAITEITPASE